MTFRFLIATAILVIAGGSSATAASHRHARASRVHRYIPSSAGVAREEAEFAGMYGSHTYPPLSGTVSTPIPLEAARYMGYPYNVPGYRYDYADGCLLRVGGVFGPGPSIAPCPFGLDRAN